MNVKYDLVIDFARPSKSNTIMISEGDTNSRVCHFTLLNNKHPMSMSDVTVATVRGIKKDGSEIFGDAKILTDDDGYFINELEYTIPAAVTDTAGNVTMTITLLSTTSEQLTSFEFYLQVRNALYNEDDLVSESDLTGFRDLLNRALVAVKKVEDLTENDTLPNPYPIDIDLEGVHYQYTGRNTVEVKISDMAYIADDPVLVVDPIDETAANTAAQSAREARAAADEAITSRVDAEKAEKRAEGYATESREIKTTVQNAVGMAEAYTMVATEGGLAAEGWAQGTQNGEPVGEDSPYWHQNAKWFAGGYNVENRLDSVDPDTALSANMGRVLNDTKANKAELPTKLNELEADSEHMTVTQEQIDNWNSGSSDVEWNQILTEGTKIAEISINGETTEVFASHGGGGTGTSNYQELDNKPKINNVELNGNKTLSQLGIPAWAQASEKPSYTANDILTDTNDSVQKKLDELDQDLNNKTMSGTKAEFDAIKDDSSIPIGSSFDITDDYEESNILNVQNWATDWHTIIYSKALKVQGGILFYMMFRNTIQYSQNTPVNLFGFNELPFGTSDIDSNVRLLAINNSNGNTVGIIVPYANDTRYFSIRTNQNCPEGTVFVINGFIPTSR